MHEIELRKPIREGQRVAFTWRETTPSGLYRRDGFTLTFPASVPIEKIPKPFWDLIGMMCLHQHWNLLRPCRVILPFTFRPGVKAFWERFLETASWTLETYRDPRMPFGPVHLVENGPMQEEATPLPAGEGCAIAFSSGKDSLLQTGLLAELGLNPLLVTTTSPLPPSQDHTTARRRELLGAASAWRDSRFVEVQSDFRDCVDNNFTHAARGYYFSINEVADTFLYLATTAACAYASGATHLFLASEAEVQENRVWEGRVVQHPHFMYSVLTQRAINGLLRQWGLEVSSLTSPLPSLLVQDLLCRRYPNYAANQYSCWRAKDGEWMCGHCGQCFRIGLTILASGCSARSLGINWAPLLAQMHDWRPREYSNDPLPKEAVSASFSRQITWLIQNVTPEQIAADMDGGGTRISDQEPAAFALRAYAETRRAVENLPSSGRPRYRPLFGKYLDPLVRDRVLAIYAKEFESQPETEYFPLISRIDAASDSVLHALKQN